jgi:NADPH-dependent ferric siderophore reductase
MSIIDPPADIRHAVTRIRHETRRRLLTVANVSDITPRMRRVELTSPDLAGFTSLSPDDHVKLFLPDPGALDGVVARDYTPRRFDAAQNRLVIDFALHEAGPATAWALSAKVGDTLQIGGPRGSAVVNDDFDWVVLAGDETALPSIGRRVETLRADVPVFTVAVVDGSAEHQSFATRADWRPTWVHRRAGQTDDALLLAAMRDLVLPDGDGYVWIAAEAKVARALRDYWFGDRGHPKAWVKSAGYWVAGQPGVSEKQEG